MSLLVISPHLDDAVLSCGELLSVSEAMVVTVFSGIPETELPVTDFDVRSGWSNAIEAVRGRRAEDLRALGVLDCHYAHLSFLDRQYAAPTDDVELIDTLTTLRESMPVVDAVLVPLGLLHPDHEQVNRCCRAAFGRWNDPVWFYADLPGRVIAPAAEVVATMERVEAGAPVWQPQGDRELKAAAIACYRSQAWALNIHECLVGERYYLWERA